MTDSTDARSEGAPRGGGGGDGDDRDSAESGDESARRGVKRSHSGGDAAVGGAPPCFDLTSEGERTEHKSQKTGSVHHHHGHHHGHGRARDESRSGSADDVHERPGDEKEEDDEEEKRGVSDARRRERHGHGRNGRGCYDEDKDSDFDSDDASSGEDGEEDDEELDGISDGEFDDCAGDGDGAEPLLSRSYKPSADGCVDLATFKMLGEAGDYLFDAIVKVSDVPKDVLEYVARGATGGKRTEISRSSKDPAQRWMVRLMRSAENERLRSKLGATIRRKPFFVRRGARIAISLYACFLEA